MISTILEIATQPNDHLIQFEASKVVYRII
jgi:hypothetical protein